MSQEISEDEQQRQLFGNLFGFKVGDRVKHRVKQFYQEKYYWIYGVVTSIMPPDYLTGEERVMVMFSGRNYSCGMHVSKLVRCRNYERKK